MPKKLSEFTLVDHLRLRPLTQAYRTARYRAIDRGYFNKLSPSGSLDGVCRDIAGRKVLATVAFDDPLGLDMHLELVRKYALHDRFLVAENSRDVANRCANAQIASRHGVHYFELPPNPWTGRDDSRSHGIGLNWIWHNVLKPGAPAAFGFVDDDLFVTAPVDVFGPLREHAFYGDLRQAGKRWFLWAGFCIFRFDAVRDLPLDFGLDWFVGLDTGGGNWDVLYRHVDPGSLPPRPVESIMGVPGTNDPKAGFERRGEWIHEVGWAWAIDPALNAQKRRALVALLAPHLPAEFFGRWSIDPDTPAARASSSVADRR